MTEFMGGALALIILAAAARVAWSSVTDTARLQELAVREADQIRSGSHEVQLSPHEGSEARAARGSTEEVNGSRLSWSGQRWALRPGWAPYRLGYASDNEIKVLHEDVAPHQAIIDFVGGEWLLVPLETKNPTLLNGRAVSRPALLTHGDSVKIGSSPAIMFHSSAGVPSHGGTTTGLRAIMGRTVGSF